MSRVWYDPRTWFSRAQAANGLNKANTAALQSALTNYINATKNMNANKIRAALNNKRIGLTESYKNRIANGVANAVIKARKANVAVNSAKLGAVSEPVAAEAVRQAETAVNNLNKAIANINTTNFANNAAKESYRTKLMNIVKAKGIALNNARLTAAFNKINAKAFKKANNSANQRPANQRQASPAANQSQAPPAAVNNRFKNMNINTLVKSAAQSLSMSNENKVKLKAAMKAKINTLNENSMNRVRLVNANRNLN